MVLITIFPNNFKTKWWQSNIALIFLFFFSYFFIGRICHSQQYFAQKRLSNHEVRAVFSWGIYREIEWNRTTEKNDWRTNRDVSIPRPSDFSDKGMALKLLFFTLTSSLELVIATVIFKNQKTDRQTCKLSPFSPPPR